MIWLCRYGWCCWLVTLVICWLRWCYRGISALVAVVWLCRVSRSYRLITLIVVWLSRRCRVSRLITLVVVILTSIRLNNIDCCWNVKVSTIIEINSYSTLYTVSNCSS